MLRLGLLAVLAVLLVLAVDASAEHSKCPVEIAYRYYSVYGTNRNEIEDSLKKLGPRDEFGDARFAYTDWQVKWRWQKTREGEIDLASVKLTCIATILLPQLAPDKAISPKLERDWAGFSERTKQHELNHVKHVEEIAPRIFTELKRAAKGARELSASISRKIIAQVIGEIRQRDRQYDKVTSHGKSEGTWGLLG